MTPSSKAETFEHWTRGLTSIATIAFLFAVFYAQHRSEIDAIVADWGRHVAHWRAQRVSPLTGRLAKDVQDALGGM